jgi:hypothetical protein
MTSYPSNDDQKRNDESGDLLYIISQVSFVAQKRNKLMPHGKLTIELPTQIPIVSSILPFIAIHTDVTCSAAFAYQKESRHVSGRERKTTKRTHHYWQ